jgi:quercetin dioxygenase-like cupin family protein
LASQSQKEPFADTRLRGGGGHESENRHGLGVASRSTPGRTRSRQAPDPYRTEEIVMSGQIIKVGQMEIRYLVDGAQTGGLGLFEMKVPAGAHVPPAHSHTHNEECVYVLEGVLRYSVDDETRDLKPGDWMSTPRGAVHHFCNPGSETVRTLVMLTPDTGEQFFREVGALAGAGGPPDRAKLMEVMTRYGLVPAAPKQAPRVAQTVS